MAVKMVCFFKKTGTLKKFAVPEFGFGSGIVASILCMSVKYAYLLDMIHLWFYILCVTFWGSIN